MSIHGFIGSFKVSENAAQLLRVELSVLQWRIYSVDTRKAYDKQTFFEAVVPVLPMGYERRGNQTYRWWFPTGWDAFNDYLFDGLDSAKTPMAIFWSGGERLQESDPETYQDFILAMGYTARPSYKTPPLVLFIIGSGEGFSDSAHEVIEELRSLGLSV